MKLSPILSALTLIGLSASAMGQGVLVEYTFTAGVLAPSNIDPAVTATSLSRGNTSTVAGTANANNLYYQLRHATAGDLPQSQAAALTGNMYVSLTLGAADAPVSLGALTFDFGNYGTAYTMDAYAFATVTIGGITTVYNSSIYDTVSEVTLPYYQGRLSAAATDTNGRATINFSGLEVDTTAEIRLYTWYDNLAHRDGVSTPIPTTTAYSLRVDNMVLSAQAIPEPGTVVLTMVGILGVAALRRKR